MHETEVTEKYYFENVGHFSDDMWLWLSVCQICLSDHHSDWRAGWREQESES